MIKNQRPLSFVAKAVRKRLEIIEDADLEFKSGPQDLIMAKELEDFYYEHFGKLLSGKKRPKDSGNRFKIVSNYSPERRLESHHLESAWTEFFNGGDWLSGSWADPSPLLNKTKISLPEGFCGWEEWEAVVTSMLKARVNLLSKIVGDDPSFHEQTRKHLVRVITRNDFIDLERWNDVFRLLRGSNGLVSIREARNFFQRLDRERTLSETIKVDGLPSINLRTFTLISNWVYLEPNGKEYPALCTMTLAGAAEVVALLEAAYKEKARGTVTPMLEAHFSRTKTKLGLQSCQAPSCAADLIGGKLVVRRL